MKKHLSIFLIAVLLLSQLTGCADPELESFSENNSHLSSTNLNKSNSARGSDPNPNFFPLYPLFHNVTNTARDAKVNGMIDHFFYGDDEQRLYYEVGSDEAYIYDSGNNDVRSEGMSYGMMITVQLDMKEEFDKLWNWTKAHMRHSNNYFAWQVSTDGDTHIDSGSAPDGEEYFAMALYFAHNRWGGSDYKTAADAILTAMLNNSNPMFGSNNLIVFSPFTPSLTDPSYHLPAFYELFARYGPSSQSSRWRSIATASRQYLRNTATKSPYGLVPDYTDFSGNPANLNSGDGHNDFRYDAWRTVMNITLDLGWSDDPYDDYGLWPTSSKLTASGLFPVEYNLKFLKFFKDEGISSHGNQYIVSNGDLTNKVDWGGEVTDHSAGLVAMNAVGARWVYSFSTARAHAQEFWNTPYPSGQYRYYDGCLYMFGMLFSTGNYNVIDPGNKVLAFKIALPGDDEGYETTTLKSEWTGKMLTATNTQNDADVKAQPENSSWESQDWQLEPVEDSPYFRLKNIWTNKYLNVQNQGENAKVVGYELHENWTSMQWALQPVSGSNAVRIKNVWSGRYLTVENNNNYANIWAQTLNPSWGSQKWIME